MNISKFIERHGCLIGFTIMISAVAIPLIFGLAWIAEICIYN